VVRELSIKKSDKDRVRMNDEIRVPEVRLIGSDGEQIGIVSTKDALARAASEELDLVELNPNMKPPVCRIMNFGKFMFEKKKKDGAARKKQKLVQVKEIKFRVTTEDGDYQVKLRNLIRFLEAGDKGKITIRFRGREMAHPELGMKLMQRIKTDLVEYATVEFEPKQEGRQIVMILSPKKK
jgi:translation initiation factor IF-3